MTRKLVANSDQLTLLDHATAQPAGRLRSAVTEGEFTQPRKARSKGYRPHGTGGVVEKGNRWYGQWWVRGRRVKRSLGPVREPGTREGLTRKQAEARLRELMLEGGRCTAASDRTADAWQEVGDRRNKQLARIGRKPDTTLANYESEMRVHYNAFFEEKPIR